ncbi:MAG: hypothetical protein WC280_01915 [Patescibacteria group bacterium]
MDNLDLEKKEEGFDFDKRLETLEKLVRDNIELNRKVIESTDYIKKYVFWKRIMFWFKIVFIAIPLIVIFIYLPPFLADAWESIQELLVVLTDTDKLLEVIIDKQAK